MPVSIEKDQLSNYTWPTDGTPPSFDDLQGRMKVACGGKTLLRPLLSFPKSRLLSTCESNNIAFVTDPSNLDVTYTPRNAVRHILSSYALPRAFSRDSLLTTISKAERPYLAMIKRSNELMSTVRIMHFDIRSGSMCIAIPKSPPQSSTAPAFPGRSRRTEDPVLTLELKAVARTLSRLAHIVQPYISDMHESQENIVRANSPSLLTLWPSLWPDQKDQPTTDSEMDLIVAGKVHFKQLPSTMSEKLLQKHIPSVARMSTTSKDRLACETKDPAPVTVNLKDYNIWKLDRRPFRRHSAKDEATALIFSDFAHPPNTSTTDNTPSEKLWSGWKLWDRFWIRLSTPDPAELRNLTVRPLVETDMREIGERFRKISKARLDEFENLMGLAAPGKVRYTLPVIANDEDRVLALPTLDVSVPFRSIVERSSAAPLGSPSSQTQSWTGERTELHWQVLYKWVDPKVLSLATGAENPYSSSLGKSVHNARTILRSDSAFH